MSDKGSPSLLDSLSRYHFVKLSGTNNYQLSKKVDVRTNSTESPGDDCGESPNGRAEPSVSKKSITAKLRSVRNYKRLRIADDDSVDESAPKVDDIKEDVKDKPNSDNEDSPIIIQRKKKKVNILDDSFEVSSSRASLETTNASSAKTQTNLLSFFNKKKVDASESVKKEADDSVDSISKEADSVKEKEDEVQIDKSHLIASIRKNFIDQTKDEDADKIIPVKTFYNDSINKSVNSNITRPLNDFKGQIKEKEKKVKKKRKRIENRSDSDEEEAVIESRVYDSDVDSDDEVPEVVTGIKGKVLEFLNTAPEEELSEIKYPPKKISALVAERPFSSWRVLVRACHASKGFSTDILNTTQELLTARGVLKDLMRKCDKISERTASAVSQGANIVKQPSIIGAGMVLKSYQMVGLNWLTVMHNQKLSGILADEMGLGKTIQVIAFLAYLKEQGLSKPDKAHLIVVPASTLENWYYEFEKWCPGMIIAQYYGSQQERRQMRYNWVKHGFEGVEVILSTYNIVSGSYEDRRMFQVLKTHYVIFDEGHLLKNMNTQRYETLFRINAERRLLLTGTPIQNSLLELMSLLVFVMPTIFHHKSDYIKYLFDKRNKAVQDKLKFDKENIVHVKKIMKPFILRRLKDCVLTSLPTKTSCIIECPMLEAQAERYEELVEEFKESTTNDSSLSIMCDLRKMANHPLTVRCLYDDEKVSEMADLLAQDPTYKETVVKHVIEDLSYLSDHKIHQLTANHKCISRYALPESAFLASGKFAKLDELLPDLKANNHRLLIFSQFCFVLDLLEEYMRIRDYNYLRFDGSTPVMERQQMIDLYNEEPEIFVFLLTTKAGGVGINLTAADTVIINDVDYNPYNDKQAEDRVHRMGQKREVKIIRFISKGTIEETIWQVAQAKTNLGKEVTSEKDNENEGSKNVMHLLRTGLGLET